LNLNETRVTDDGLARLENLVGLCELHLNGAQVTAEGVDRLRQSLPSTVIRWDSTGQSNSRNSGTDRTSELESER
jgi:hypothetical protein